MLGVMRLVCPATGTLGFSQVASSRSLFESRVHGLCSNQHHALTVLMAEKDRSTETLRVAKKFESSGFEPNIRRFVFLNPTIFQAFISPICRLEIPLIFFCVARAGYGTAFDMLHVGCGVK